MVKDNTLDSDFISAKIPEVRFNLKDKKSTTQTLIKAIFRYQDDDEIKHRLVYSTRCHVIPKYWNSKTQRAKNSVEYPEAYHINKALEKISAIIKDVYRSTFLFRPESVEVFRGELDYVTKRKERPAIDDDSHKTLLDFIDCEILRYKRNAVNSRGGQTWQKYQTVKKRICSIGDTLGITSIDYDDINDVFVNKYISSLRKKELSENTISKDIEILKTILKRSSKYHTNEYYLETGFGLSRTKVPKHFPVLPELMKLFNHKFDRERQQRAIDLYLISAFGGGLRWSDIQRISAKNEVEIDGQRVLQVFTFKGRNTKEDNEVVIPITPQLRHLINKYDWDFPKMTGQEANRTLKEAFKTAGLDRNIVVKSGVKGKQAEQKKLYEVVTFHTARYAYINYMLNDLHVSVTDLQKITGQSLKVLMGYENGDKKKNALHVADMINSKLTMMRVVKNEAV